MLFTAIKRESIVNIDEEKFTIIPIVNPDSEAGRLLLDENRYTVINASSRDIIDIFYPKRENYLDYCKSALNELAKYNKNIKTLNNPCILLFWRKERSLTIFNSFKDDDHYKFEKIMLGIIERLLMNTKKGIVVYKECLRAEACARKISCFFYDFAKEFAVDTLVAILKG